MKRFHEVKQSIVGVKITRTVCMYIVYMRTVVQFQVNMMERSIVEYK